MIIENYISENKILEFNFHFKNDNDKIILFDILSSLMIMKFQIHIDEEQINNLKLKQYSFKYDWNEKEKINFIEIK